MCQQVFRWISMNGCFASLSFIFCPGFYLRCFSQCIRFFQDVVVGGGCCCDLLLVGFHLIKNGDGFVSFGQNIVNARWCCFRYFLLFFCIFSSSEDVEYQHYKRE